MHALRLFHSLVAVHHAACLCDINWLGGCILNIQRCQRSSYRCLGKSFQTCSVLPFIRMKRLLCVEWVAGILKRLRPWRWTPSLTWTFWCLSSQTRCFPHWPHTSLLACPIQGKLVRICILLTFRFVDPFFQNVYFKYHSAPLPPMSAAHAGNADMIQPGLIPLQPNLDFMDSFDPLQGCGTVPSSAAAPLN